MQTNVHELATFRHHQLNVKLFVLNNKGYVSIQNTQKNFFNSHVAGVGEESGISFPNLEKLADAYGLPYLLIDSPALLSRGVKDVLNRNGPVLCEILSLWDWRYSELLFLRLQSTWLACLPAL